MNLSTICGRFQPLCKSSTTAPYSRLAVTMLRALDKSCAKLSNMCLSSGWIQQRNSTSPDSFRRWRTRFMSSARDLGIDNNIVFIKHYFGKVANKKSAKTIKFGGVFFVSKFLSFAKRCDKFIARYVFSGGSFCVFIYFLNFLNMSFISFPLFN